MERDYSGFATGTNYQDFNSHAHVERDYSGFATGTNYQDFNSHAHVERDQRSNGKTYAVCISTHTLTWSVTFNKGELKDIKTFQLTRSRGA